MQHDKNTKHDDKHNEDSFMYAKDYTDKSAADVEEVRKRNHAKEDALISKIRSKLRGRAGRWRGKNGAKENNKARGGKFAR